MLIISARQMRVLGSEALRAFEARLEGHLVKAFPRECNRLGSNQVRRVVKVGIDRAGRYGYRAERDVFLYLCLMLMLGWRFDEDPQLPWAASHLSVSAGPGGRGEHARLQRLHSNAMSYLDYVAGENNEYLVRALVRIRDFDVGPLRHMEPAQLPCELPRVLALLHPRKAAFQGEPATRQMVERAMSASWMRGLTSVFGQALWAALAFMLGAGFADDPQLPWAEAALACPAWGDGESHATALYSGAMAHVSFGLGIE